MRIGITSDFHLGFAWDTERGEDSFIQASEALDILSQKCDLIIIAGDIFDSSAPNPGVWEKAYEVFSIPKEVEDSGVRLLEILGPKGRRQIPERNLHGVPVVAIHGTHEITKKYPNPVKLLEKAHFVIHLHPERAIFEKDGEKIGIFGIGGVPERFARAFFEKFANLPPVEGGKNVFVFHQSVKEYLPFDATLSMNDLPRGYDLYVCGHIHWPNVTEFRGKQFLIPGSTVATQLKKFEAEFGKCVWIWDTETEKLEKIPLKTPRDFFYFEVELREASEADVRRKIEELVEIALKRRKNNRKPLVKIVLKGTLVSGLSPAKLELDLPEEAIVYVEKQLESPLKEIKEIAEKMEQKAASITSREYMAKKIAEIMERMGLPIPKDLELFLKALAEMKRSDKTRLAELIERGELLIIEKEETFESSQDKQDKQVKEKIIDKRGGTILDWLG